jgi:formyltetrahydrofolate-dependent phosphoribosylglycinamide formyltransferase
VFASGGGTNLQTLLDLCRPPGKARVGLVVSDRTSAGALDRARAAGVETEVVADPSDGAAIIDLLARAQTDLIVLAGYLKLVPLDVVRAFDGHLINVHPALLPSFGGKGMYGIRVHRAVIESGATISGATVHMVSEEYDRGTIIAQWPVPVLADDTPESLAARVLEVEHELLPAVVLAASRADGVVRLPLSGEAFVAGDVPNVSTTLVLT